MKKQLFLALILIFAVGLLMAGTPRTYLQRCSLDTGLESPDVTNTGTTHSPNYIIRATNLSTMEVLGSDLGHVATTIRVYRGGTAPNQYTATSLQLGTFPTQWVAGDVIRMFVQHIASGETATWDMTVPAGGTTINIQSPVQVIPPYTPQGDTYNLNVNTLPTQGYGIIKNAVPTGQVSDYVFTADNADALVGTYTMAPVAGYHWEPAEHVVTTGMFAKVDYNAVITFTLVQDPPPPDNYTLNVTGPDGYAIFKDTVNTGQQTDYAFMGMSPEAPASLVGTYYLGEAPVGFHWEPAQYVVVAGDFMATKADYSYTINFMLVEDPPPPDTYTLNVYSTPTTGYEIFKDAVSTTQVTNYAFTGATGEELAGTYTLAPVAGYHWVPASFVVAAGDFHTKSAVNVLGSVNDPKVDFAYSITFDLVMDPPVDTYTYNLYVNGPDGYAVTGPVAGVTDYMATDDVIGDLLGTYTIADAPAGWHWVMNPIVVEADDFVMAKVDYVYNATIEFVLEQDPIEEFTFTVNAFDLLWYTGNGYIFGINMPDFLDPNDLGADIYLNNVDTGVNTPYIFGAPSNLPFVPGAYSVVKPGYTSWLPSDLTFISITTDYDADFLGIPDDVTPVELSSFTATLTAETYVQLTWVSQTETQMMGYLVYRNTSNDQSTATLIDNPMIPATNTSSTQSYTVIDNDVNIGTTYYYWLEAVDFNSSSYHGPVSVTVEGNVPPVLPEVTSMRNAYPNPFKANSNTTIEVEVKAGENGTITIYNVLGQVVKTVSVSEGTHSVNWNGKDSKGNACGSGIYFYKLSTPSINVTKKMVIVK